MPDQFPSIDIVDASNHTAIRLEGGGAVVTVGTEGKDKARVEIKSPLDGHADRFVADAHGSVSAGGHRASGALALIHGSTPKRGVPLVTVLLEAHTSTLALSRFQPPATTAVTIRAEANDATLVLGGGGVPGQVALRNAEEKVTTRITAAGALIRAGANGAEGTIVLGDASGRTKAALDAKDACLRLGIPASKGGIVGSDLVPGQTTIELKGQDPAGASLSFRDGGKEKVRVDARAAQVAAGGNGTGGRVVVRSADGGDTIALDGKGGQVILTNREGVDKITMNAQAGRVACETSRCREVIAIDEGGTGRVHIDGGAGLIRAGFSGQPGTVEVRDAKGRNGVRLQGSSGTVSVGGQQQSGTVELFNTHGNRTVLLEGEQGRIQLGRQDNVGGELVVRSKAGAISAHLDGDGGNLWLGGNGRDGDVVLFPSGASDIHALDQATIHLNGGAGDIILQNADCAEDFSIGEGELVEPGCVMVIESESGLRVSSTAYDRRVAGVISGAGPYRPGIVLGRKGASGRDVPIALIGKVYCKVDAHYAPIAVGDLLTTSPTAGHAMQAADPDRTPGAVVGKALRAVASGRDVIPILVALQ